jgi:predicted N-acetyltransferase YhbS
MMPLRPADTSGVPAMPVTYRSGTPADAATAGAICYEAFKSIAGRHAFPADFPSADAATGLLSLLLARSDVYSVVAEMNGRIVGSNFLWENGVIAGVGPITIDPSAQNEGVGRRLMVEVLKRAKQRNFAGVRLVQAAYHSRSLSLYAKLGFDAREPLSNVQGPPLHVAVPGCAVRAARAADADDCNALCRRVHGHDRAGDLAEAIADGSATVVERAGRITGYATVVGFFGHAVAETNDDLKALIAAADGFAGPGFLVPTRNGGLLRWCLANGLRVVQPLTLMSAGLYNAPAGAFLPSILY